MGNLSGSVVSYNDGKFKLAGTYDYTDGAILFTAKVNVTDKFKSKWYFHIRWSEDGVNWKPYTSESKHNADLTFGQRNVTGEKLYVGVNVGDSPKWSSDEITVATTYMPELIDAKIVNDNCASIRVKGKSRDSKPVQNVTIERSTSLTSGWSSISDEPFAVTISNDEYDITVYDEGIEAGNRYYYRAKAYNAITGSSAYLTTENPIYTSPDSSAITNVTTSQSGNNITINWTCSGSAIQSKIITKFYVQRSDNGGTYTTVGTVNAVTGQTQYSYTDTVSEGGSYQYQVSASNDSGGTSSGGTGGGSEIETAPASPSSISVYRAESSDNVVITVAGNSSNAESVVIDRCIDGGQWAEGIATINYASTVTYTDTSATASDNIVYRAKYTNSKGSSGYVTSDAVIIKQKPNAPTLKSPISGAVIDMAAGTVRLVWQHRPKDGSPQTAATLQYKIGTGSWTSVSITTATYYDLSLSGRSANDVITWKVCTKGSHADYSDYSTESTFTLKTKPVLAFTEPDNADVIDELPVVMEFSYNDACGTLEKLTVDIIKKNEVVKTVNVDVGAGTSGTYTHSLAGFLFDNNSVYGLKAYALSSSGLSDETSITISIQYAEVSIAGGLLPMVVSDSATGYAYITCLRDITPGQGGVVPSPVAISEAYLYRVHDGETILISAVSEGLQITDKHAPINIDYQYKLLLLTTGGAVSIVSVTTRNDSPYWFCYFGDEIAKAKWNPEGSVKLGRPQRTEVRYSGRRYPVSYDQDAIEETFDFTTVFTEREDLNQFRRLMRQGGTGIWKSGDGDVYDANFEFSYSSDYRLTTPIWNASLSVTRIDGGDDR